MLFVLLLCSFVVFNNALPVSKVNLAHHSLLADILEHKNDPEAEKYLLGMVDKLDPASIQTVITLIQGLLSKSQEDLTRLTTAASTANNAFNDADGAHNAALVAQIDGRLASELVLSQGTTAADAERNRIVTDLTATHEQILASLQADVDATLASKVTATTSKTVADAALAAEESRLNAEIDSLTTVIGILSGVKKINIPLSALFVIDPNFSGTYAEGVAHCAGMAGAYQIASVHTQEENDQLFSQVKASTYLGAVETSVNGVYEWDDGSTWDYINPSNDGLSSAGENRVMFFTNGEWHDAGTGDNVVPVACRQH